MRTFFCQRGTGSRPGNVFPLGKTCRAMVVERDSDHKSSSRGVKREARELKGETQS